MPKLGHVGAQSYSFRKFDFKGALDRLADLGLDTMEFCAVHFPPDPDNPGLGKILAELARRGVSVPCYGVEAFGGDAAANRRKFEFARALGARFITADPAPESFDGLEALVEEFGVGVAIHNHGPGARYDKAADTLRAVDGRHPLIGACVDTGHALRSGEAPHDVIAALGPRVLTLHLKDWKTGGAEAILGEGGMDMPKVAAALRGAGFAGPISMEFELDPDDPTPGMARGLAAWRQVTGWEDRSV